MLLSTNGTLFAIQNMTWNGAQGLSEYPCTPLYAPYHPEYNGGALAGSGYQGVWTAERGLTFYTAHLAGHELPGYTPGVAYRMLEILLGKVSQIIFLFRSYSDSHDRSIISATPRASQPRPETLQEPV